MKQFTIEDILRIVKNGEDSRHQFKQDIHNIEKIAEEIVAFSNSEGGIILVGIEDKAHAIIGLKPQDVNRINMLLSNAVRDNIKPSVYPTTQNLEIDGKTIIIVTVPIGIQKPYQTASGKYLIRAGADKAIINQETLERMIFDNSKTSFEELPVSSTQWERDLDKALYYDYFERDRNTNVNEYIKLRNISLEQLLRSTSIIKDEHLTYAGLICFCETPQQFVPSLAIDAVHFPGTSISDTNFISKERIVGSIGIQYKRAMIFLESNLRKIQKAHGFNSMPELEIAREAIEEAVVNALVHRNNAIQSTIKIFIYSDRVEMISPGKLFNSLTVEGILHGNSRQRNQKIASIVFDNRILPYSGAGSGIRRIMEFHPQAKFENNTEGEFFKVLFERPRIF